jgi:ribosomal protein L32
VNLPNPNVKQKEMAKPLPKGKTSEARRNSKREIDRKATAMMATKSRGSSTTSTESVLSARKTCDILGTYGIEAQVRLLASIDPVRTIRLVWTDHQSMCLTSPSLSYRLRSYIAPT